MESLIVSSEVFTFTPVSLILPLWYYSLLDVCKLTTIRGNFYSELLGEISWFNRLIFIFYWLLWWAGNWMLSTKIRVHQNSFGEGFPCDSPELATLSYLNIFNLVVNAKTCRLRCVMLISVLYKMSWREVVMKLKVKNLTFLVKTLWQALRESNKK